MNRDNVIELITLAYGSLQDRTTKESSAGCVATRAYALLT